MPVKNVADWVPAVLPVLVIVITAVCDSSSMYVGELNWIEGVGVPVGVTVGVAVGVAVPVGVAVGVAVGVPVPVGVAVGVAVGVPVPVGVAVGVGVGVPQAPPYTTLSIPMKSELVPLGPPFGTL